MRRKRDIILDFTSLLDVIMIILFFFILFSHFETIEAKSQMAEAEAAAESASLAADKRKEEAEQQLKMAEEAEKRAQQAYERLEAAGQREAANYDAFQEFEAGENLRIELFMKAEGWTLGIMKGEYAGAVHSGEPLVPALRSTLSAAGCTPEKTMLCTFSFDASSPGTKAAYDSISAAFTELRKEYTHLYISESDESKRRAMTYE